MNTSSLERRVSRLEEQPAASEDPVIAALETLDDAELDLMQEVIALDGCEHTIEEIVEIFGERWPQAEAAIMKFGSEWERLSL